MFVWACKNAGFLDKIRLVAPQARREADLVRPRQPLSHAVEDKLDKLFHAAVKKVEDPPAQVPEFQKSVISI